MLGAGNEGTAGTALVTAYGIGTGVFSALFLMNFGAVLGVLSLKQSAAAIAIGYLASTVLFFAFLFFGRFESVLFCASMGPVAAAFLFYGVSSLQIDKKQANALPRQADPEGPAEQRQLLRLICAFGLTMLVCGVSYELSRTLYVQMGQFASSDVAPYAVAQACITTLTAIGSIGVALVLITSKGVRGPRRATALSPRFCLPARCFCLRRCCSPTYPPTCRWPSTSPRSNVWAWACGSSSPVYAAAIRPRACSRSGLSGPHGQQARSWAC